VAARALPRDRTPDASLALLREGYCFVSNRCERLGTDGFRTRLMLKPVVCLRGPEAARLFYGGDTFTRLGGMPGHVRKLLLGTGGVQQLDGPDHRARKELLLRLVGPEGYRPLLRCVEGEWQAAVARWQRREEITLLPEARLLMTRAVCAWAGVPLLPDSPETVSAEQAARWMSLMIDEATNFGPAYWRARRERRKAERWIARLVEIERAHRPDPAVPQTPLQALAAYRDGSGRKLPSRVVAVETLNLLRPTMAVGRYLAFAALALHHKPAWAVRLRRTPADARIFAQEVRRFYPFFPVVGGRARRDLHFRGERIRAGTWVLLDLYGTNRDPDVWEAADVFRPERFANWREDAFTLVPQGGGDHLLDHRCPGEWIAIAAIEHVARELTGSLDYEVPPQNLDIRRDRVPARPASGMILRNLRPRAQAQAAQ
jgi:fatty-acid peroxygenase